MCKKFPEFIKMEFGNPKVAIIGYQPAIIDNIKDFFETRVLDLNPEFVDTIQYNVKIEDGIRDYEDVISWADLVICTGSTLCNNSIINFLSLNKPVYYYGTTIAGASNILGLKDSVFVVNKQSYHQGVHKYICVLFKFKKLLLLF